MEPSPDRTSGKPLETSYGGSHKIKGSPFCLIIELALREVSSSLPETLEARYLDFLIKYLRACYRELGSDGTCQRILLFDQRRHIYFYGPPKEKLLERLAMEVSKLTISGFKTERRRLKRKSKKRTLFRSHQRAQKTGKLKLNPP